MICRLHDEVLLLDREGLPQRDASALERHASSCPDCGPLLLELRRTNRILRAVRVEPGPRAEARVWENIRSEGRENAQSRFRSSIRPVFAFAAAAAVAGCALLFVFGPPAVRKWPSGQVVEQPASERSIRLTQGALQVGNAPGAKVTGDVLLASGRFFAPEAARMSLPGLLLDLGPGASFDLLADDLEPIEISLEEGKLGAIVRPREAVRPAELITRDARIRLIGGRVQVEATEHGTVLETEEGASAVIWEKGSALPRTIGGKERIQLAARSRSRSRRLEAPAEAPDPASAEEARSDQVEGADFPKTPAPIKDSPTEEAPTEEARAKGSRSGVLARPPRSRMPPSAASPRERPGAPAVEEPGGPRVLEAIAGLVEPKPKEHKEALATARAALPTDSARAAQIAEQVLEAKPSLDLEAEALAVLADAQRHRGMLSQAAELYARLASHPGGASYAEEALLRRAMLFEELGDRKGALAELARAETAFPRGVTAPERASLEAKLFLLEQDPLAAAEAIERAEVRGRSMSLLWRRADVAAALARSHPERALELLAPLLDEGAPIALRSAALEIAERAAISRGAPEKK